MSSPLPLESQAPSTMSPSGHLMTFLFPEVYCPGQVTPQLVQLFHRQWVSYTLPAWNCKLAVVRVFSMT